MRGVSDLVIEEGVVERLPLPICGERGDRVGLTHLRVLEHPIHPVVKLNDRTLESVALLRFLRQRVSGLQRDLLPMRLKVAQRNAPALGWVLPEQRQHIGMIHAH